MCLQEVLLYNKNNEYVLDISVLLGMMFSALYTSSYLIHNKVYTHT